MGKSLQGLMSMRGDIYEEDNNNNNNSGLVMFDESCLTDHCNLFGGSGSSTTLMNKPKRDTTALHEAEKAMTEELYNMSMEDREKALHDIHGVAETPDETPELVTQSLHRLEIELQTNFDYATHESFQVAMDQNPQYVRGMYLMFLRCESFDISKAANLLMRHFDTKQELFGRSKLAKDITLDDFDNHDMAALKAGYYQILPYRDRAGRVIFVKVWYHEKYTVRENSWRALWYITMAALQDEETQKKGQVAIIYNVGDTWKDMFDGELYAGVGKAKAALPMKNAAIHYCFSDPAFGAYVKFITTKTMGRNPRIRARLHQGT